MAPPTPPSASAVTAELRVEGTREFLRNLMIAAQNPSFMALVLFGELSLLFSLLLRAVHACTDGSLCFVDPWLKCSLYVCMRVRMRACACFWINFYVSLSHVRMQEARNKEC